MSSNSNVVKNKKLDVIEILDNSKKARILFLIALGISALGIRFYFFPYDVPLFNDAQGYFWYAIDMSILNQMPPWYSIVNNGWPSFLSIIFQLIDSDNFLDYHNVQRFVGVLFSVATIMPVYVLCSRYFKKSYSLLGVALFAFEPRLIQNSFLGTPESMYVFLMASLLCLFLASNFKKIYLAFGIVALLSLTRFEGLLMIIPVSLVFFIRFRKQKKDLMKFIICISIFILILMPIASLKNEISGQDGLISHISAGPMYYQATIQENSSTLVDYLYLGSSNLIKYIGWAQIPSFIIFIPLGLIFIFKGIDYKKITIIVSILVMLAPAFYGYSRELSEMKYLYVLYPTFCVLACFSFKIFLEKIHRKNLIFSIIIGGIILSSIIFVQWKAIDDEHYRETYQILTDIGQKEMKINKEFGIYGGEFLFLHWVTVGEVEKFPFLRNELPVSKITYPPHQHFFMRITDPTESDVDELVVLGKQWQVGDAKIKESAEYHNLEIDNLGDYFQVLEKQKITYLILDKYNDARMISGELKNHLRDMFNHEGNYPFLIKEYDSKENGFNYHVKLFKIDYDLYNEWINEN